MNKVNVNDRVRSKKGIIGIVEKIYERSVMIKILKNPTDLIYENEMTIINHKNYEILQKTTFLA